MLHAAGMALVPSSRQAALTRIWWNTMSEEQFTNISMAVLLSGLILFMGFIIWDLGKQSNAGRFGMFVLFLALGFGVTGFVFKELLVSFILAK